MLDLAENQLTEIDLTPLFASTILHTLKTDKHTKLTAQQHLEKQPQIPSALQQLIKENRINWHNK
jgi:hypothetical protein